MTQPNDDSSDGSMEIPSPLVTRKSFLQIGGVGLAAGLTWNGLPAFADQHDSDRHPDPHPGPDELGSGAILASDRFPIGVFWPPPPLQTTVARYREIVEAGFTFAHGGNYTWADAQIAQRMLQVAEEVGLQVLVDDGDLRFLLRNFTISDDGGPFTLTQDEASQKFAAILARYQATWQLQSGRLLITGGSGDGSIGSVTAGTTWTDYTLSLTTQPRPTGAGGHAQSGWAFRMQDERNAYVWLLSSKGESGKATLTKAVFVDGSPRVSSTPLSFALDTDHRYRIETTVEGSTITTVIDGVTVDTTTDTTYSSGTVGLREAGTESAYFDDVRVEDTSGRTLFSEDFGSLRAWTRPSGSGYTSYAGMHLYDEPSLAQMPQISTALDLINELDPDGFTYVNQLPGLGAAGYDTAARLDTPVLSFDRYPILSEGEDGGYFENWAEVRTAALAHGRRSWAFIQSVGYTGHAVPDADDLRWQISISLAFGCTGIQYFTYWTPDPARGEGFHDGLITVDGRRTALYRITKEINRRYLAPLGAQLLDATSTAVQSAGVSPRPAGLTGFAPDEEVESVSGDPVVLGRFRDARKRPLVLVANHSRHRRATSTVRLRRKGAERFDPARDRWSPIGGQQATLRLDAGEAVLIRITA